MSDYRTLNALPPSAFLNPETFRTALDGVRPGRSDEQYRKGMDIGRRYERVGVCANGTWFASGGPDCGHITSYEGIGYHSCTADLLRGFLESGAEVWIYRDPDDGQPTRTRIK